MLFFFFICLLACLFMVQAQSQTMFSPGIRLDRHVMKRKQHLLVCAINVSLVQLLDMLENVRQSNLQLVFCRLFI